MGVGTGADTCHIAGTVTVGSEGKALRILNFGLLEVDGSVQKGIVVGTNCDLVPVLLGAVIVDIGEGVASIKCICTDACDTVRNLYATQVFTVFKRRISNTRYDTVPGNNVVRVGSKQCLVCRTNQAVIHAVVYGIVHINRQSSQA